MMNLRMGIAILRSALLGIAVARITFAVYALPVIEQDYFTTLVMFCPIPF